MKPKTNSPCNLPWQGYVKFCAASSLVVCAWLFVITTWRWPLAGDAALMHYVGFLANHGFVPYKNIKDVNLPGAYLADWLAQTLFGPSALAWRLYDFGLLAALGLAMWIIARPYSRFAAVWAALLFALIHARDGIEQVGQRDLAATPLTMFAVALLVLCYRHRSMRTAFFAGLCSGCAMMIKPTLAALVLLPAIPCWLDRGLTPRMKQRYLLEFYGGLMLPIALSVLCLVQTDSWPAFIYIMRVMAPYHTSMGHVPLRFLLYNAVSPVAVLVLLWAIILFLRRKQSEADGMSPERVERWIVLFATAASFLSYLLQRKAYVYHRYPMMALLLLSIALEFTRPAKRQYVSVWLGWAGLLWAALVLAPSSVWKAAHYEDPEQEVINDLQTDLPNAAVAQHLSDLSGNVQCLDSVNGCVEALERMQVLQSSGMLYDEFLFNIGASPAITGERERFRKSLALNPPAILVITAPLFPSGPANYAKLGQWPEFQPWLTEHYVLFVERTPNLVVQSVGRALTPPGYRIYLSRTPQLPRD